ncbi:MAG: ATP-binding cassette domain-containing protein [Lactobacillales bacterium]|jgi:putative ABC transport system permease protein|nr:ATP-binding cassette domain-containing protein [Lactobacillales bacterium]
MLQLKNIKKSYTTNTFTQIALNDVSINFRESEFVAILGPSGSGKTTLLNIVGGLDTYDSGDLLINGKSTKNFKDKDWDAYRNNSVGFIFQSYNLISHLSILENVEMGMTLSGVSSSVKKEKAMDALKRVGLEEHVHKRPNQLSGGQMQRVAIARALANDPDIILADEPTGALDTKTSEQIMDLIKEIAKDKLVIMVTHNPELAESYADRIVNFLDGKIIHDSNPDEEVRTSSDYSLKKTSMSIFTALNLSGRNIATKKWRTALTAFAASIGIIGIALILSLSNGFQKQIDNFQTDALSEFPIIVAPQAMTNNAEAAKVMQERMSSGTQKFTKKKVINVYDPTNNNVLHQNKLTTDYVNYVEKVNPEDASSVGFTRIVGMNLLRKVDGNVQIVKVATGLVGMDNNTSQISSMSGMSLSSYPAMLKGEKGNYLQKNYDVLDGRYPENANEVVLVVDEKNQVDKTTMENLGFSGKTGEMSFEQVLGMEMKLVPNDSFYAELPTGNFLPNNDLNALYEDENDTTLKVVAIVRQKEDVQVGILGVGIAYSDQLVEDILAREQDSAIVTAQKNSDFNVMTLEKMDVATKQQTLTYLGGDSTPMMIYVYPKNFEAKERVVNYLDAYNKGKAIEDKVIYTDLAKTITDMTGGIMDAITLVLVAFASISLVVSLIMVGIITYISVLERTKEIGILRALGARKKDITRVFNAETFIIGAFSGLLGIAIAYLLTIPANILIKNATGLSNVAQLNPIHALLLVTISVILTLIGGMIPARMAAKKDPVEALRSE